MQLVQRYEAFIDYCPSCKGVWLDRGEIDKIAQVQSSYEDEHYNQYHYRDGRYDDYYYNNRWGRRGFFGSLFDF
jgi:Zn-finger nucleic acid-binding protein